MSIHWVKGKGAFCFSFKRKIRGKEVRATKLLPKGWTREQADKFDIKETARIYAEHSGVSTQQFLIEDAVLLYMQEHVPNLKTAHDYVAEYHRLMPLYEGKSLSELPEVAAAINKLPLAPASRRTKIRMLAAACNYGFKYHGMGDSSPSARVVLPKVKNARTVYPSRAEVLRMARLCKVHEVRAAILTAYYSGMRQGEIRRAVVDQGLFKLYDTKNGEIRFVPIHPKLKPYLKHFPMSLTKMQLYYPWKQARDACGLHHLHFHDIRHTAATEMLNAGATLKEVGGVLGHKDTRSTEIYAHLLTTTLMKAVSLIGKKAEKYIPNNEETLV